MKKNKSNLFSDFLQKGLKGHTFYTEMKSSEMTSLIAYYERKVTMENVLVLSGTKTDHPKIEKLTRLTLI